MSQLDINEIAGQIIAGAQATGRSDVDLRDAVADAFVRLTDGLSEDVTSLIGLIVNRRLGLAIV